MKKVRAMSIFLLFAMIFIFASCAPLELQGSFEGKFSLLDGSETEYNYRYTFYGDGQATATNTKTNETIRFIYTAMNGTLTVSLDNRSCSYSYDYNEKDKELNIICESAEGKREVALDKK